MEQRRRQGERKSKRRRERRGKRDRDSKTVRYGERKRAWKMKIYFKKMEEKVRLFSEQPMRGGGGGES